MGRGAILFVLTQIRRLFGRRQDTSQSAHRILFIELSEMGSTILANPTL